MSRATVSKSRADKAKDKDKDRGGSTSVPVPPVNSDVIPGRFTENDWNSMLDKEDGEDFVIDIVGNIVDSALTVIYDNYIQKQLYPYVVTQARDAILQIIEWQFLARDEGETQPENDATWLEEDEPMPCVPDAWAQGSVPQKNRPLLSPPVSEPGTDITHVSGMSHREILEDVICESHADIEPVEIPDGEKEGGEEDKEEEGKEEDEKEGGITQPEDVSERLAGLEQPEAEQKTGGDLKDEAKPSEKAKPEAYRPRKPKFKPRKGRIVHSAGLRDMHKSLDEMEREMLEAERKANEPKPVVKDSILDHMPSSCHSILKKKKASDHFKLVQAGRPPGSKDVNYDDRGNVISVVRLDPEKLPSHRVRTQYAVVDPAVEAAHARLVAMRTGRYISQQKAEMAKQQAEVRAMTKSHGARTAEGTTKTGVKPLKTAASLATLASSHQSHGTRPMEYTAATGGISPLPPPLIESMELSPGVVVKEGNRIKRGPKPQVRYHDSITSAKLRSLRPVNQMDMRDAQLAVADIISAKGPLLRPLPVNEPIPPIATRPTPPPQKSLQTA
ncbi:uncharacterized protein C2orf81-like isoform X1 [Lytechinus variegatus]|uniref:uncharacterized protein C2orf81-like isoform X1 n=1 Tax=Lytechinus variegatus TaxID=7654 RepID=UPI001BB226FB|nr:uncharacterized protein C2orf81-like isoform X1 [Lytechinus variegatus]